MNFNFKGTQLALTSLLAMTFSTSALMAQGAAESFEIQSADLTRTVQGISTDIPVNTSGTSANVSQSWAPKDNVGGLVGVFAIKETTSNQNLWMSVQMTAITGVLTDSSVTEGLGIFQTTNSQGLTDEGSLSVYIRPANSSRNRVGGAWSMNLSFSFYEDEALTIARPVDLMLTTLDLDYSQRYYTNDDHFQSTSYPGDNISDLTDIAGWTGYTAAGGADVDDPKHAVASLLKGGRSSFDIRLQHTDVALFMFEFRNPPNINPIPVPEPGSMVLIGLAGAALLLQRRRRSVQ